MEARATYDPSKRIYKLNGSKTWLVGPVLVPFLLPLCFALRSSRRTYFRFKSRATLVSNRHIQDHKLAHRRPVGSVGEVRGRSNSGFRRRKGAGPGRTVHPEDRGKVLP